LAKGPAIANSEEVELFPCRKAMEFAMDDGLEFIIEGDNITIMKSPLISGSHLPQTGHIVQDVQCLLKRRLLAL